MGMRQKIQENRRRQYLFVQAHKRRIRDEIRPHLKEKRREWWTAIAGHKLRIRDEWLISGAFSRASPEIAGHKLRIRDEWRTQQQKARAHILDQRRKHRATIIAHKRRI